MRFPLNWLLEYIDLDIPVEEISKKLTSAGLEVESIEEIDGDTVIEIGLTPNLGHCASLIGIARELSAATGKPIRYPDIRLHENSKESISDIAKVSISDSKECPRYACRIVKNVEIGPSPEWMRKRLEHAGLHPINNIVDIANYVVHELGHPLHAFDLDHLSGSEISVRAAQDGEKIEALDGKCYDLAAGDLLICDREKPVALAGIIGGKNSEVSDHTKHVLLEAAFFSPVAIRRTRKRLGITTDASKRFERGVDPNGMQQALNRAAMLLQEIAKGQVVGGMIDHKEHDFPEKRINLRLERINQVLGLLFSVSEVEAIFVRLGMKAQWDNAQKHYVITVPTYRVDITQEIDLIEEVARIYGYENIGITPARYSTSTLPSSPIFLFERKMRAWMLSQGLQEVISCDLISPASIQLIDRKLFPEEAFVKVLNPTSIEQSVLRASLLPGMLDIIRHNIDHQVSTISAFEIGRIHVKEKDQYQEHSVVGVIITGKREPHDWADKPAEVDFYDLKGIVENVLTGLNIKTFHFKRSDYGTFHTGRQALISVDGIDVGTIGEVHPSILRQLDIPQRVYFAELSLHDLIPLQKPVQRMKELALYPSSERDWTVTVKETLTIQELKDMITQASSNLVEDVSLLDIYRSDKLGSDVKNVTFHFVYRDRNKTVAQEIVDAEHARIIKHVQQSL